MDDSSDILGGRKLVPPSDVSSAWFNNTQIFLAGFVASVLWLLFSVIVPRVREWRSNMYRTELRRRYGIPDDDHRPFSVAYAAVTARAREERQSSKDTGSERGTNTPQPPQPNLLHMSELENHLLRQRHAANHRNAASLPGTGPLTQMNAGVNGYSLPHYTSHFATAQQVSDVHSRDYTRKPVLADTSTSPTLSGSSGVEGPAPLLSTQGKHAREDESPTQPEKKSRFSHASKAVAAEEQAELDEQHGMDVDEVAAGQPKRGSKRSAARDDDEGIESSRAVGRGKRARKFSHQQTPEPSDEEMVDDEIDPDEARDDVALRGKKRDRAEADSTFSGDEYLGSEDEAEESQKLRRHRKRRNLHQKKAEVTSRGQKRSRDLESVASGEDEPDRPKRRDTRKKRGKRASADETDLLFDAPVSNDPLCKGRKIGEEWEANGVLYKVGPNGQRLRQEYVKKSVSRFPMPKDSQHPDRRVNMDLYVEKWLTEEEYQEAKEKGELAWQNGQALTAEPSTLGDVPDSPSKPDSGKNLLWSSTTKDSPVPHRGPFRQSIATNMGIRVNPFQQSRALPGPGRRVSSIYHVALPPTPESPKLRTSKSYSKWEKQDLEAAAMAKIREKQEANRAAAAGAQKTVAALATSASTSAPTSYTPINLGQPVDKPAASAVSSTPPTAATSSIGSSSLSFPMAPIPATFKPASEPSKTTATSAFPALPSMTSVSSTTQAKPAAPSFALGPSTTSTTTPTAPAAAPRTAAQQPAAAAPSTNNNFSLKAASVPSSTASTNTPSINIFGAAGGASQPSATPAPAPATNAASKSAFSFAAPPATNAGSSGLQSNAQQGTSAPSLLSRLGPPVSNPPASAPAASSSSAAPSFSFAKPNTPAAAPAATAPAAPTPSSGSTSSDASAPLKFSFGTPLKPATSAPTISQPAANALKPTPSAFGFGAPSTSTNAGVKTSSPFVAPSTSSNTGTTTSSPFGAPSAATTSNPFGGSNASSTPATGTATTTPKFSFGITGGSTTPAMGSAFGGSTTASKPAEQAKPVFGASPFGGVASTSTSAFGNPQASSSSNTALPSSATAPQPADAPQSTPKFSFNFAGPTSSSSSSTPAFGTSSFGAPSGGPSAFGAQPSTSGSTSVFGAQPSSSTSASSASGNTTQSSSAPSMFNFSNTSSGAFFGASNQNAKQ